jgi:hypothetical protein
MHERRVHALPSAVTVGKIALLNGQTRKVLTRHGADLAYFANKKIGKWLLRLRLLGLRLRRGGCPASDAQFP